MSVSEQLRSAIQDSLQTQTLYQVAKGSGVNWSALQRFVTGQRPYLRSDTIDRLCEFLGLELCQKKPQTTRQEPRKKRKTAAKEAGKK